MDSETFGPGALDDSGLPRGLDEGDYVILSSGAIATARRSYPRGYSGILDLLLDGAEISDTTAAITLPSDGAAVETPDSGRVAVDDASAGHGESRGTSLRMED
jgi:hypothetical protein